MRIAVCRPQVPFVYGGAEVVADQLVDELRARGHEAEIVSIPFKWYPGARVLDQAFLWRLLDLTEADGRPIDLVIATKFPSYCVRHPNKVVWLVHQFRQAYDYDRTELGQFSESPTTGRRPRASSGSTGSRSARRGRSSRPRGNVADRLERSRPDSTPSVLPHPPQKLAYRTDGATSGFVLSVNRLDRAKRIDLLIEAAKSEPDLRIVIVGDGPDRERLEKLASGLNGRVEFTGRVDDEQLADLYARCLAVYYAPVDEDFGMVPYEAFLSAEAGRDDDRRGRAARGRPRPRDRRRRRARPGRARAGLRHLAAHVDEAKRVGRGRQGGRRARHLGRVHRRAARVKVAYYSPMPPSRSGIADYSALLLPALRERIEEVVVAEPGQARSGRRRRALPRRQRPRRARLDRRRAAPRVPASSCCTSSSCTT